MLDFLSPPKIVSDARDSLCLFILLSSEKNEPRSAAAVIGLLARRYGRRRGLRNSLRSDSPRPFPSVFLASSPPDKGGIGDCALACILTPFVLLTPPSFGHLPYILLYKTQGRSVIHVFLYSSMCFLYNNIKHSHLLPLYCCVTRQGECEI